MKTIIIGSGEVGTALGNVLKDYDPFFIDIKDTTYTTYSATIADEPAILHICFPYSETFIQDVLRYQEACTPAPLYTVIHSTVPVGTSRKCAAIHSPIRGIHPHLEEGIRTFVKFIGGEDASKVADYFRRAGLRVMLFDKTETTEAMKLLDTEYYREVIEFAHRAKRYCDYNGLNFHEVYTLANETYNEGYTRLGRPEFVRPVLQPIMTPIGGHCVTQNHNLIKYA